MSERLFVGNLHYEAGQDDLLAIMSSCGPVVDCFITTRGNRRFGFVEFADAASVDRALQMHHSADPIYGRRLVIRIANSRPHVSRPQ